MSRPKMPDAEKVFKTSISLGPDVAKKLDADRGDVKRSTMINSILKNWYGVGFARGEQPYRKR